MHTGTICKVKIERGFGFISEPQQPDCFFHASDLAADLEWSERLCANRGLRSTSSVHREDRGQGISGRRIKDVSDIAPTRRRWSAQ